MAETNGQNNRRSGRQPDTPQRVSDAAEQMRNTSSHGTLRGYVPQQTGTQRPVNPGYGNGQQQYPYAVPQGQMNRVRQGFVPAEVLEKPKKKKGKAWLWILLTIVILGGIGAGAWFGIQYSKEAAAKKVLSDRVTPYDGLYCPGVYVDGIALGGMTPEQAMNTVQSQMNQRDSAWKVQLTYDGNVMANITTATLNMKVDQNELNSVMNEAWKPGHTGTLEERNAQMDELEKTPYNGYTARPSGDTGEIDKILNELKVQIDTPAQDAQATAFDPSRVYPFIFSEEKTGLSLDIEPVKEKLYQMVSTMTGGTVELHPDVVQPAVTVADLETHYALRGQSTTPIDKHSTDDRNNNIRRCFQLISGRVIQPGKSFSFNTIVGPRTMENGFFPAIEYINDEHVEGIGGGACQASTTVYQAAVRAGMEITSRRPHSDSVSYAEYGMDATVYMGGKQIDLVFKNTTEEPIYITAEVLTDPKNPQRLMTKVCIYGASLGNTRYELETQVVETLPSLMDPVYVKDKESESKARDGCIVESYRVTYVDGNMTDRKLLYTDTYNPKPEKIYQPSVDTV